MVKHNDRNEQQLKQRVERKTDNALGKFAIVALVICAFINAYFTFKNPGSSQTPVPDIVFYILGAAIVPDAIRFLRGEKP